MSLQNVELLERATVAICRFLLEFFVTERSSSGATVMRPLTNSNFVCDFYRYQTAEYYAIVTRYLKSRGELPPSDYEQQYQRVMEYFWSTKVCTATEL